MSSKKLKIGIIAAEHSGDRLGANLLRSLKNLDEVEIFGLGGPEVNSLGISTPDGVNHQDLQVMGLVDPLLKLPKLLSIRKKLFTLFSNQKIDIFIGVDSLDFNMFFHKKLKGLDIKTIQVVSPSVWGWRENRIKPIKKYVDLTACLFNFEDDFYKKKNLPSIHLGHPFSELFPKNKESVIKEYNLNPSKKYISILPGSRSSEIKNLLPTYIEFIKLHSEKYRDYEYLIPASDQESFNTIEENISKDLPVKLNKNCATDFLSISDFSVVTSGTATLESAVLGARPIICYKTNPINYFIISRMLKIDDVGLPNLLLGKREYPELIQKSCNPQSILEAAESIKNNNDGENISITLRNLLIGLSPEESAQKILSL